MHDGAVVVRDAEVVRPRFDVEVVSVVPTHVVEENFNARVAISSTLFVMQSNGVTKFVSRDAVIGASADAERDFVIPMLPSDHGIAAAFIDDRDVISMTGSFRQGAAGGSKANASLVLPFLHSTQNNVSVTVVTGSKGR